MPQLQINQGPQDALLYDNSRSYFTNVGYVRTSNFQVEYRKVDAQNTAQFGSTVQFVIPKAADLLGPVDLRVEIPPCTSDWNPTLSTKAANDTGTDASKRTVPNQTAYAQWVDELGFAMIEKITFSIGSNDIETITGEQLQLKNELMTSDEMRLGHSHILKTSRPALSTSGVVTTDEYPLPDVDDQATHYQTLAFAKRNHFAQDFTRLIALKTNEVSNDSDQTAAIVSNSVVRAGKRELVIPLGLFFTKHVSQYFPLAAVAGCNDVRIAIKFRSLPELIQLSRPLNIMPAVATANLPTGATAQPLYAGDAVPMPKFTDGGMASCNLFCHYVHVTGPEAQLLMNKEHVRLMKLYQHQFKEFSTAGTKTMELDLSFLHPVSTLLITIRRQEDMNSLIAGQDAAQKGYFFYHGDGANPNYDRATLAQQTATTTDPEEDGGSRHTVKVESIALTLNGQERHPGLSGGIDAKYLKDRVLPMLFSNSNQVDKVLAGSSSSNKTTKQMYGMHGAKNIFVYPFSLNPEGSNPSGAVNFSKVSHAKLSLKLADAKALTGSNIPDMHNPTGGKNYRVDVYAMYYNWLQIKDGRALLSFA